MTEVRIIRAGFWGACLTMEPNLLKSKALPRFDIFFTCGLAFLVALWAVFAVSRAEDLGMTVHGWIFLGAAILAALGFVFNAHGTALQSDQSSYLTHWHQRASSVRPQRAWGSWEFATSLPRQSNPCR